MNISEELVKIAVRIVRTQWISLSQLLHMLPPEPFAPASSDFALRYYHELIDGLKSFPRAKFQYVAPRVEYKGKQYSRRYNTQTGDLLINGKIPVTSPEARRSAITYDAEIKITGLKPSEIPKLYLLSQSGRHSLTILELDGHPLGAMYNGNDYWVNPDESLSEELIPAGLAKIAKMDPDKISRIVVTLKEVSVYGKVPLG